MTALPLTEVCVESIDAVVTAQDHGADRVELCASLPEGGLTPSLGVIRGALEVARVPVHVMIRPRGGDFLYSDSEYASVLTDLRFMREVGVPGVVLGCLTPDAQVDTARLRELVCGAGEMSVTFHRAFDLVADPFRALEDLIACGVRRVLTSGQQPTALLGQECLRTLVQQAGERIVILGCGGVRPGNVAAVLGATGLREIHFSARRNVPSRMRVQNRAVSMGQSNTGQPTDEYSREETSGEQVAATIAAARGGAVATLREVGGHRSQET
ncbi:copper homeostasis protein CutC [Deinococcus altitudinis]|uniref:copper homeostasis protein CutC n=1 Tax=Deinococcus altitudinis TaxID=468914 RepID=UPI003891A90B